MSYGPLKVETNYWFGTFKLLKSVDVKIKLAASDSHVLLQRSKEFIQNNNLK